MCDLLQQSLIKKKLTCFRRFFDDVDCGDGEA